LEIIENVLHDSGHWCEDLSGNIEDIKTDLENLQYKMVTVWNEEDD
jgi:hypothetical protein